MRGPRFTALGAVVLLGACATSAASRPSIFQDRPGCAGDICAPESAEVSAGRALFDYWLDQSNRVRSHLGDISNRSKLFGDLTAHYRTLFAEMELAQREGIELFNHGDRERAWTRLNALWMALPVVTLQLNYVILASHAEDAGMITTDWMAMLGDMNRRAAPVLNAALDGFDRGRMEAMALEHRDDLAELQSNFPKIQTSLAKGGRWTRHGLLVADGITLAVAAHDMVGLVAGRSGSAFPIRFPGLVGVSGSTGGVVMLSAQVLESMRELVRLGAISTAAFSVGLSLMVGKPEAVGHELRLTGPQLGKKFGEHRDTNRPGYRTPEEYRALAEDILNDPRSRKTVFDANAPKYPGETHYLRDKDLLRLAPNGEFRSLYPIE